MTQDMDENSASAAEIATIKGDIRMLSSEMTHSIGNVSKQLDAMQRQVAEISKLTAEVARHQMTMETQSAGLERAFNAISAHHDDFQHWRDTHVADNDKVAKTVVRFGGVLFGFAAVVGLLSAAVITIANQWVTTAQIDRTRIEKSLAEDINALNARVERQRNEFDARLDILEKQK